MVSEPDDAVEVIVCQGPPLCELQGADAWRSQKQGCRWCERHTLLPDGTWDISKPGEA